MTNLWSDGKTRSDTYPGPHPDIVAYFAVAREEELLRLRWDNEAMRQERNRLNALATPKVKAAHA